MNRLTTLLVTCSLALALAPISSQSQDYGGGRSPAESEAAQQHFWAGIDDYLNFFPSSGARHFEMALEADPGFGLAKVLHAWQVPGLPAEEREAGIAEGIAMMGYASSADLILAAAVKDAQGGNAANSSRTFAALSEMYPDDPRLAMYSTFFRGARGDDTDAAAAWTDLNTRFPDFAPPYNLLAYNLWNRGNRVGAMEAVRSYVELAPDHPNSHDSYAELLQWDGQYGAALHQYARAAELDAEYDGAYVGAAEVYWLMGKDDEAVAQLEIAIEHAVTPAVGVNYRRSIGNIYLMRGDLDEGMEHLQAAADFGQVEGAAPAAAFAYEQMAVADAMLGDGNNVAAHLAQAAELRGDEPAIHQLMVAIARAESGDVDGARAMARELMKNNEGGFFENFGHGVMALADIGEENYEGAMRHLALADPTNPVTQAALAVCFAEMGMDAEADSKWVELENNRQINLANAFLAMAFIEKVQH
ncbi:MAG: hypothetical protein IIB09_02135 [Bacteroidetes bacterium]|nr:hypothetical protein [Bacteroidota bacterium]